MSSWGWLKLALLCIDSLAWPMVALGYPLFASMRAIESGSKHYLKKLAIYWTLFSLISLFEFAFVKLIEWIPFWSSIKLMTIVWLVIPRFDGACSAYQSFIRPYLILNVQEAIRRFEEQSRKKETFLDVVDKYMKENGVEALEKLIAAKKEHKEPEDSKRGTLVREADEKNLKEPEAAEKDKRILEAPKEIEATDAKRRDTKETTHVAVSSKGTLTPPETTSADQNKQPIKTPELEAAEWACHLCQVSTTGEKNMNDHLRGKKHMSMLESLKLSKLSDATKDHWRPVSSSSSDSGPKKESPREPEKFPQKQKIKTPNVDSQQNFKHWCALCGVKLLCDINLADHLRGKKHAANLDKLTGFGL